MNLQKIARYFSWLIISLYFFLATWVLFSDRFDSMQKELRIIFAVFLYLYGGWRVVRLWSKYREEQ